MKMITVFLSLILLSACRFSSIEINAKDNALSSPIANDPAEDDPAEDDPAEDDPVDNDQGSGAQVTAVYETLVEAFPTMGAHPTIVDSPYAGVAANPTHGSELPDALWRYGGAEGFVGLNGEHNNPAKYVSVVFDAANNMSFLARMEQSFLLGCLVEELLPKTNGVFDVGNQSGTITPELVASEVCGPAGGMMGMLSGISLAVTVTALGNTTNYDSLIATTSLGNTIYLYYRNSNTTLNMHLISGSSSGGGGHDYQVHTVSYNKTTGIGSYQLVEVANAIGQSPQASLSRAYFDEEGEQVSLMRIGNYGMGTIDWRAMFNLATTYTNQTHMALSMTWTNVDTPYDTDITNGNACITTADSMIVENQTNTCTANGKTALDSSGSSVLLTAVEGIDPADVPTAAAAGDYADNLPTFTEATIVSAGLQL